MAANRMRTTRTTEEIERPVVSPTVMPDPHWIDQVRMGPVIGGFLAGLCCVVLLSMLGIGLGITAANPWAVTQQGTVPSGAGWTSLLWAGVASIISYFI